MSTHIAIGFSQATNPEEAAQEAARQAKSKFKTPGVDLALVFASPHYGDLKSLTAINSILKPNHLIGSCSNAVILSEGIFPRGIAILAMNSQEIFCSNSAITNLNNSDLRQAGFELAKKAGVDLRDRQRQAGIVFADQIFQNSAPFIQGAHEAWGTGFPMVAVVGSSDSNTKPNYQFFQKQAVANAAVSLLLGGDIHVAFSNRHGFKPLGKPRTITQSQGCIIQSIDNKPAVHIYTHFLPTEAPQITRSFLKSHATLYPLGIYIEEQHQYLLRNPVDILIDGSIVCQGDVPQGAEVHLMINSKDACRRAGVEAAREITDSLGQQQAKAVLIFESTVRRKILGRDAWGEIQAIKEILGPDVPIIGMGTSVQLAPFKSLNEMRAIYMHNENILMVGIG